MPNLLKKQALSYIYGIFLIAIFIGAFLSFWPTPFSIFFIFLILIFGPGFSLSRLLHLSFANDTFGQIIISLTLGLIFNLFLGFSAVIIHLNINQLVAVTLILSVSLFIAAMISDSRQPGESTFSWRKFLKTENIIIIFLGLLILSVLMVVDELGTNFTGDPLYHLAIIRKVVDGQSLSTANLSYVKDQFHLAYIFPVWHVFLGVVAKITQTDIISLYREISTILTLISFLVWYWLFLKILPSRQVAILALFLLILYYFGANAYLYTRLAVPDVFNNLLLLPLAFGLALKYIFDNTVSLKMLITLSILLLFMGLIHWTQYFYYLTGLGLLALFYSLFQFREADYKITLKRMLLAASANMIMVIPLLVYLKGTASANIEAFSAVVKTSNNDRFSKFPPYVQLSLIFVPALALFWRKYRPLLFLLGVYSTGAIIFNVPFVYHNLRQYLSHVFVNRFYSNLGEWPYVTWALVLGFILVMIDRLVSKNSRNLRLLIDSLLGLLFVSLLIIQLKTEMLTSLYEQLFSTDLKNWLTGNYIWLFLVLIILGGGLYFWPKSSPGLRNFFTFDEPKNHLTTLFLTLILVLFLSVPTQGHLITYTQKELANDHFCQPVQDMTAKVINFQKFGGQGTIDFIRSNIPAKAVFDSSDANYVLPILADVHMASYTYDPEPTKKYEKIYDRSLPEKERLSLIKDGQIEYIVYLSKNGSVSPFDQNPLYFTKIYSGGAAIYKVNRSNLN